MGKQILNSMVGVLSGAVFVILYNELHIGPLLSATFAIVIFIGIMLKIGRNTPTPPARQPPPSSPSNYFWDTIEEGHEKIKGIRRMEGQIKNANVKPQVAEICRIGEKIIERLRKYPKDVRLVRSFFTYYLDATYNIITKYLDLTVKGTGTDSSNYTEALIKTEQVLGQIIQQFEDTLRKLEQEKVYDLDAEIAALEQIIAAEDVKR